jgi:hypothetical protein
LSALLLTTPGCKSQWINANIENRSGETVRQLEVDYPSASFGTDFLTPGATLHYRLQIRGSGPIQLVYSLANGHAVRSRGPVLVERQQGQLTIVLLPQGKTEFEAKLQPAS